MKKYIILLLLSVLGTLFLEHFIYIPTRPLSGLLNDPLKWLGLNRQIFEIFSFLSGPCIAIIGIVGLWQLKINKDTSKLNSTRQAFQIANERCDAFQNGILNFAGELNKKIIDLNITFFDDCKIEWNLGEYKSIKFPDRQNSYEEIEPVISDIIILLNRMDSFAAFFTSGVAEESLAFSIQGKAFCEIIKEYFPVIILCCYEEDDDGEIHRAAINGYEHLIILFMTWNKRLEKYRLNHKKAEIVEQLMENQNKLSDEIEKIDDIKIKSIGT